jgi:hypothetical protein
VEIEEFAKREEHVPHAKHYAFRVDKERVVVDTPTITGTEILAKVGKTPEGFKLYQHKRHHQPVLIGPQEVVDLRAHGVERFTTWMTDGVSCQAAGAETKGETLEPSLFALN